ncbi:hypothetical protein GALMADRAFT_157573 [Galerina marginata CBS 339.88]|uniref:Uncharacterized protein n=1 Tax=Galerina marginata (strain CBS 339.88) TaxID=685588 RepID=A0A067T337_GALM3|nr:hypothetical protein GALMADRAFT_157573 [Galerina marginata CBS 339.88]
MSDFRAPKRGGLRARIATSVRPDEGRLSMRLPGDFRASQRGPTFGRQTDDFRASQRGATFGRQTDDFRCADLATSVCATIAASGASTEDFDVEMDRERTVDRLCIFDCLTRRELAAKAFVPVPITQPQFVEGSSSGTGQLGYKASPHSSSSNDTLREEEGIETEVLADPQLEESPSKKRKIVASIALPYPACSLANGSGNSSYNNDKPDKKAVKSYHKAPPLRAWSSHWVSRLDAPTVIILLVKIRQ